MSQTKTLIKTLKKLLRRHGITYADIAKHLQLSEVSIKRMFSQQSFNIDRLNSICSMLEIDFIDLVRIVDDEQEKINKLTESQDIKFFMVAICVQNSWTFDEIIDHYKISKTECISYLTRLDRLGLIQLLPNNKIRKMVAHDFRWIPNGPIEKFFEKAVQSEFLRSHFTEPGEQRLYLSGTLSKKSIDILNERLKLIANEFSELQNDDAKLPVKSRHSAGLMLAIRPWEFSAFSNLRRIQ